MDFGDGSPPTTWTETDDVRMHKKKQTHYSDLSISLCIFAEERIPARLHTPGEIHRLSERCVVVVVAVVVAVVAVVVVVAVAAAAAYQLLLFLASVVVAFSLFIALLLLLLLLSLLYCS